MNNVEATPLPTKTVTEKRKKGQKIRNEKTPLETKKAIMRQKFAKGEVEWSKLTMFDLIYYNPDDGERLSNATEKLQMRLKPYEVEALSLENQAEREESTGNAILDERLAEEEEMSQNENNPQTEINYEDKQPDEADEDKQIGDVEKVEEEEEEDAMPVPQIIDTSETKQNKNQLKRMLGTNFSLMVKLFPGIDRIDLKRKFKSEEKTNPSLVDKIIATQIPFDISQFIHVEYDKKRSQDEEERDTLKNSHTQEPVNDDECHSDEVLGKHLESPTKKIPSKNSKEEVEPHSKKGKKLRVAESESPVESRKPAGFRIEKLKGTKTASRCDSDGDCPTRQIGLEQGGLTVVENPGSSNQTPSFLVPPALAEGLKLIQPLLKPNLAVMEGTFHGKVRKKRLNQLQCGKFCPTIGLLVLFPGGAFSRRQSVAVTNRQFFIFNAFNSQSRFQFYASDTSGHFHPVFAASEDNFEWPTSSNSFSPRRIKNTKSFVLHKLHHFYVSSTSQWCIINGRDYDKFSRQAWRYSSPEHTVSHHVWVGDLKAENVSVGSLLEDHCPRVGY
ncbi:hypothetical protein OUZ56_029281 [Daphnia magna]|uniref:Transcription factor TFIIIB component B'' Myb domain-containing protein n=1 Tax=Daphnia magna TaxID=35525 RepID=A0ABR0B6E4_9CRUS|nr:hypothetical protein OUZ56_029281 [Daphnia magna]